MNNVFNIKFKDDSELILESVTNYTVEDDCLVIKNENFGSTFEQVTTTYIFTKYIKNVEMKIDKEV